MVMCIVQGCDSKSKVYSTIMFHRIPTKKKVRINQWLAALNIDLKTPLVSIKKWRVCSEHFGPDDYLENMDSVTGTTVRRLKDTAIPTIFRGRTGSSGSSPMAPKLCCEAGCQTEVFTKDTACQTDVDLPIKHPASTQYTWKAEQRIASSQIKKHEKLVIWSSHTSVEEDPLAIPSPLKRPRREATDDLSSHPEETDLNICKERVCSKNISAQSNRKLQKSAHVPAPTEDKPVRTKLKSGDQLMSEDQLQSGDQLMSEDQIMSGDQLMSEDQLQSEDQIMSGDQLMSEDQLVSGDQIISEVLIKSEDQLDLDICKVSVAPAIQKSSTSSTTTKEELLVEPVETKQQPERRLEVSTAPVASSDKIDHNYVRTPNPVTVGNRVMLKERQKKSHLMGLFPTCLQCGGPVLEYTTVSFGNQNRLQWKCSKGHLMWLFPNSNPT